jgi:chromosome segregation ATPase
MDKITFDKTLGISEDEQKEILNGLDTLTKNNLASTVSMKKNVGRQDSLFPLLVNAIAVIVLVGGLITMWTLQAKRQEAFIAGGTTLSGAERRLIAEIRKETAEQLNERDMEIADIREKLASIDVEIGNLQKEDATEAIEAKIKMLMQQKDEYQARLAQLQAEKGKILEEARLKENSLKNKNDELSRLYAQTKGELTEVQEQLQKLTTQGEKADVVENQFRGYYAILNEQVKSGFWDAAGETVSAMKELLETPSLQENRFFQAQKDSRRESLDALSCLIAANLSSGVTAQLVPPEPKTSSERESENQTRIASLEESIAILEKQSAQYEKTIVAQERAINNYKNQENNLNVQQQTINDLRTQNAGLQQTVTTNNATINDLRTQNTGLQQTATTNNATINDLRTQNTGLQQTITTNNATISDLRTQNAGLQQTVTTNNATLNDLRTQNETLQQRTTQLQQQNDAIRQLLNGE